MSFKVGDVVQLNSGGPKMTVTFVGDKKFPHGGVVSIVSCTWFKGEALNKETFKPELLSKVEK
ncbi:YodC family protein [Shewanella algae]|uniref:YodC family protein n=1 Tax=Shewanella algae TaxID=38313 RepID=UPI00313AC3A6